MRKKLSAVLLCLAILVQMVPTAAWATEVDEEPKELTVEDVPETRDGRESMEDTDNEETTADPSLNSVEYIDDEIIGSGFCGADGNEENVTWTLTQDGTLTISGTGAMKDYTHLYYAPWNPNRNSVRNVIIESGISNIGAFLFEDYSTLVSVIVPDTVTTIGNRTFTNCTNLMEIAIPDSVTYIGSSAFSGCESIESIVIPSRVTTVNSFTFVSCINLKNVTIPDDVTLIEVGAFKGCEMLTSIIIPEGTTSIGESAFRECTSLSRIDMPNSVTSIGLNAFLGCTALSDVYYSGTQEQWNSLSSSLSSGSDFHYGNSSLFNATIHFQEESVPGRLAAPTNLRWETEQKTYTEQGFTQVMYPGSLSFTDNLNTEAFYDVIIYDSTGNKVSGFGFNKRKQAEYHEDGLSDGFAESGTYRFSVQAQNRSNSALNSNVVYSDYWTYTRPDDVLPVPENLRLNGTIAQWDEVTGACGYNLSIGYSKNSSNPDSEDFLNSTFGIVIRRGSSGTQEDISKYDYEFGAGYYCLSIRSISSDITKICNSDWSDAVVVYSDGAISEPLVFDISFNANGGKGKMPAETVTAGQTYQLPACRFTAPEGMEFAGWSVNGITYAEGSSVTVSDNTTVFAQWKQISQIIAQGYCGDYENDEAVSWVLTKDGTLTISGTGHMSDFDTRAYRIGEQPWFNHRDVITTVVVGEGVTNIGSNAFYGCNRILNVKLPSTVTSINFGAFQYCDALVSVELPSSLTTIEAFAFWGCSSLSSVQIPPNVTTIGAYAFWGCISLTSILVPSRISQLGKGPFAFCTSLVKIQVDTGNEYYTSLDGVLFSRDMETLIQYPSGKKNVSYEIPASVIRVETWAFEGCINLNAITVHSGNENYVSENGVLFTKDMEMLVQYPSGKKESTYTIPASVKHILDGAFQSCSALKSMIVPQNVASMNEWVFWCSTNLKSIQILGEVKSIPPWAFWGCKNLTRVDIPASVSWIGSMAFYDCSSLTDIYYGGTVDQWIALLKNGLDDENEPLKDAMVHCSDGDYGYSNIDVGYEILDRIHDMYQYEDQTFRIAGALREFEGFYLDDQRLTVGTDFFTEEGSTRIHIPAKTFENAGEGQHRVQAVFRDSEGVRRVSTQSYTVDLSGETHIDRQEIEDAVKFVPYTGRLKAVPNYPNVKFYLISGSLPDGLVLQEDGQITGVPTKEGESTFTVGLRGGKSEEGYADQVTIVLRVLTNTSGNVANETDTGFKIIEPIPNMTVVSKDEDFVSEGDFQYFKDFYLDGILQVRDVDYEVSEGSTRIKAREQALKKLGNGEHTAAAKFVVDKSDGTQETNVSSQNFTIGTKRKSSSSGGGVTYYNINLSKVSGGTLSANRTSASGGTKVTIKATPKTGYILQSVSVTGTNVAGDVSVQKDGKNWVFTMPNKHVTVSAVFLSEKHDVSVQDTQYGTLIVNPKSASKNTAVTITAYPDKGRYVSQFNVVDSKGSSVKVTDNKNGTAVFTMPDNAVRVSATFEWERLGTFQDIDGSKWFFENAKWAYNREIIRGVTELSWMPEMETATSTVVVTLARLAKVDLIPYWNDEYNYSWIPSEWYTAAARWAAHYGILTQDIFTGRDPLPRSSLALMLHRFLVYEGIVLEVPSEEDQVSFTDSAEILAVGKNVNNAFQVLNKIGVFQGRSDGTMDPNGRTKRSHLAAVLNRLSDFIIQYWEELQKTA